MTPSWIQAAAGPLLAASAVAVGAWAAALTCVMRRQDRLIFGSPRVRRTAPAGPHGGHGTRPVRLSTDDGERLSGWLTEPAGPARRLAVWFGGRNEDVGWVPAIASWLGEDWAVCSFHYRGCADSTGVPGEAACVRDALAIVAWAMAETGVPADAVVLMGRSLGSGVAVQAAAALPVAGLVLQAPPASVRRLVMRNPLLLPVVPWLRHPFDALAAAAHVRAPSLILLAERDRRVPHRDSLRLARALRAAGPPRHPDHCRVVTIPGTDHRSLARHASTLAAVAQFAARTPGSPAGRPPRPGC